MAKPEWIETIKLFLDLSVVQIQALTAWAEARGEGEAGMQAVINVIRNRVKRGGWYIDKEISALTSPFHGVCLKKYQFSCFLQNDPNFQKLIVLVRENKVNATCQDALAIAAIPDLIDLTKGATHYHTIQMNPFLKWTASMVETTRIKNHMFYKESNGKR